MNTQLKTKQEKKENVGYMILNGKKVPICPRCGNLYCATEECKVDLIKELARLTDKRGQLYNEIKGVNRSIDVVKFDIEERWKQYLLINPP